LTFRDPATFDIVKEISVHGPFDPPHLNALAWVQGKIYANVWPYPFIDIIDPGTGELMARIDLTELKKQAAPPGNPEQVVNGTAYDAENDRLFVTGKLWPHLYQIRVIESGGAGDKPGRGYTNNGT